MWWHVKSYLPKLSLSKRFFFANKEDYSSSSSSYAVVVTLESLRGRGSASRRRRDDTRPWADRSRTCARCTCSRGQSLRPRNSRPAFPHASHKIPPTTRLRSERLTLTCPFDEDSFTSNSLTLHTSKRLCFQSPTALLNTTSLLLRLFSQFSRHSRAARADEALVFAHEIVLRLTISTPRRHATIS